MYHLDVLCLKSIKFLFSEKKGLWWRPFVISSVCLFFMEIVILISWGIWMTYSGFNFRKRAADTTTYIIHFPKESLPWLF